MRYVRFILLLFLAACGNTQKKQLAIDTQFIQKYIDSNFTKSMHSATDFRIQDSAFLQSINCKLYYINRKECFDCNSYVLILDMGTREVYTIIKPGWGFTCKNTSDKAQLEILNNDCLNPLFMEFIDLQDFLNRCSYSRFHPFPKECLDSIITFPGTPTPGLLTEKDMEIALQYAYPEEPLTKYDEKEYEDWRDSAIKILKRKMKEKSARLYGGREGMGVFYCELINNCFSDPTPDKRYNDSIYSAGQVGGGCYALKTLWIRYNRY